MSVDLRHSWFFQKNTNLFSSNTMKTKKTNKWIPYVHIINMIFLLIVLFILFKDFSFTFIFLFFVAGFQLAFWGILKLRDDKKWVGNYSISAILMIIASILPLYIALYIFWHYEQVNSFLLKQGFFWITDVVKESLFLQDTNLWDMKK